MCNYFNIFVQTIGKYNFLDINPNTYYNLNMIKNIDRDFKNSHGKSILFLGKFHSLSREDLKLFLEKFDINYIDTLDKNIEMVVEGTIMSPLEEEIAYDAYKKKIPTYNTEQFEKLYASKLNSDTLLMSLKLSNDQTKLSKLLHNTHLDDTLFLKLFKMYDWGEEGLFDNSENMEISTLFTKRFYKKERFDPATFHSPISIFEIAIISENDGVLETLFSMPNLSVKQSRSGQKRPIDIKEALATNSFLNQDTLKRLVRLNNRGVDYFLAQNPLLDADIANILYERSDTEIKQALATNNNISDKLFKALLEHESAAQNLLLYQKIDLKRFKLINNLHPNIGENETLSDEVIQTLIEDNNIETIQNLSANESISLRFLEKIYALNNPSFFPYLSSNKNISQEMIREFYAKKEREIDTSLAINPSLSKSILEELYNRDDFEINKSLALNESTPIEYLQQLQLDTRLLNYLKKNSTFTENILNNLGI